MIYATLGRSLTIRMGSGRRAHLRHGAKILAIVFGVYFGFIMFTTWTFASRLEYPWYGPELSRWAYAANLIASAIFLAAVGILAFQVQLSFDLRIRELNRQLGSLFWDWGTSGSSELSESSSSHGESGEHDLDEILETVGESQTQEVHEVLLESSIEAAEEDVPVEITLVSVAQPELLRRRESLRRQATHLKKYLPGPMIVAAAFMGISAAMLPGTDALLKISHQMNTTIILGLAYSWVGLALYFATSVLGLIISLHPDRKLRNR
jgi:hypothetical protein